MDGSHFWAHRANFPAVMQVSREQGMAQRGGGGRTKNAMAATLRQHTTISGMKAALWRSHTLRLRPPLPPASLPGGGAAPKFEASSETGEASSGACRCTGKRGAVRRSTTGAATAAAIRPAGSRGSSCTHGHISATLTTGSARAHRIGRGHMMPHRVRRQAQHAACFSQQGHSETPPSLPRAALHTPQNPDLHGADVDACLSPAWRPSFVHPRLLQPPTHPDPQGAMPRQTANRTSPSLRTTTHEPHASARAAPPYKCYATECTLLRTHNRRPCAPAWPVEQRGGAEAHRFDELGELSVKFVRRVEGGRGVLERLEALAGGRALRDVHHPGLPQARDFLKRDCRRLHSRGSASATSTHAPST